MATDTADPLYWSKYFNQLYAPIGEASDTALRQRQVQGLQANQFQHSSELQRQLFQHQSDLEAAREKNQAALERQREQAKSDLEWDKRAAGYRVPTHDEAGVRRPQLAIIEDIDKKAATAADRYRGRIAAAEKDLESISLGYPNQDKINQQAIQKVVSDPALMASLQPANAARLKAVAAGRGNLPDLIADLKDSSWWFTSKGKRADAATLLTALNSAKVEMATGDEKGRILTASAKEKHILNELSNLSREFSKHIGDMTDDGRSVYMSTPVAPLETHTGNADPLGAAAGGIPGGAAGQAPPVYGPENEPQTAPPVLEDQGYQGGSPPPSEPSAGINSFFGPVAGPAASAVAKYLPSVGLGPVVGPAVSALGGMFQGSPAAQVPPAQPVSASPVQGPQNANMFRQFWGEAGVPASGQMGGAFAPNIQGASQLSIRTGIPAGDLTAMADLAINHGEMTPQQIAAFTEKAVAGDPASLDHLRELYNHYLQGKAEHLLNGPEPRPDQPYLRDWLENPRNAPGIGPALRGVGDAATRLNYMGWPRQ